MNMSRFKSALIAFSGTVGCPAKYREPSKPFSSAVKTTKSIERFGRVFAWLNAFAVSNTLATPEASSITPL